MPLGGSGALLSADCGTGGDLRSQGFWTQLSHEPAASPQVLSPPARPLGQDDLRGRSGS